MKYSHLFISSIIPLCASILMSGCGSKTEPENTSPQSVATNTTSSGSILTAPADYVAGTVKAGTGTKGKVELITLQRAIESFQQQEGRNPTSLNELLEKSYIKILPQPPVGEHFDYDPATGNLQLNPNQ